MWLVTSLANQAVTIHNLTHKDDQHPEITCKTVELQTVQGDVADYRGAIIEALNQGVLRNVETEPTQAEAQQNTDDV